MAVPVAMAERVFCLSTTWLASSGRAQWLGVAEALRDVVLGSKLIEPPPSGENERFLMIHCR